MNQTQTRSLRKKVLSLILAVVMAVSLLPISAFASGDSKASTTGDTGYYKILHLDCGRKYFSKDWIIALLNEMKADGYNQLQLAFGNDGLRFLLDDMSFTANGTTYSHETVVSKVKAGNETQNSSGDARYLSQSEMDEIIAAADKLGIAIVPLLNLPGHANAILDIVDNNTYNAKISGTVSQNTLDVTNDAACNFGYEIFKKYVDYFSSKGCKYFNFGADEYGNDIGDENPHFDVLAGTGYQKLSAFINKLAAYIGSKNMTPRTFNDALYYKKGSWDMQTTTNAAIKTIQCCYWSSGWGSYPVAEASTIVGNGHAMINTNGAYYYVLGKNDAFTSSETKKHDAGLYTAAAGFDNTAFAGGTVENPVGSMFCIWSDYPNAETETEIAQNVRLVMRAMALRMDGKTVDSSMNTGVIQNGFNVDGTLNAGSTNGAETDTDTVPITIKIGETATVPVAGDYSGTWLNDAIASVIGGKPIDKPGTPTYELATLGKGTFYVSTTATDTAPTVQLTFEDAGNGQYYIKSGDNYVYPKASFGWGWSYSLGTGKETINVNGNQPYAFSVDYGNLISTTAYLTLNGTSLGASEKLTELYLYKEQPTSGGKETTLTFTGKSAGTTSVTIGNVKYVITVEKEDLEKVTPLTVEYWITNKQVTGSDNLTSKTISAEAAYDENGVLFSTLVPATGTQDGKNDAFWKGRRLTSGNKQTNASGVDKTTGDGGNDFTYIRYWNQHWAFSADGISWTNFDDDDQVVAYYLQVTDVTDEVTTEVADWGEVPHTNFTYSGGKFVLLDYAVKYQSGNRTPDKFPVSGKTIAYHCNYDSAADLGTTVIKEGSTYYRKIGAIRAVETEGYEVYMITVTPNNDTNTKAVASQPQYATNYSYDGTEKVVWVDKETDLGAFADENLQYEGFSIGGDPVVPGLKIYNKQAMLVTYYVRAKVTLDSLHVHYIDKTTGEQFYSYPINVKSGTLFDKDIALNKANWKGPLDNGTVLNDLDKEQTVSANLSTMPEISAQNRYSKYTCDEVRRSDDGKDVYLYYTFDNTKTFVVDFGLPLEIYPKDMNAEVQGKVNNVAVEKTQLTYGTAEAKNTETDGYKVVYTMTKPISGFETINISYTGYNNSTQENGTVTYNAYVIPATSVYYEDSFATFTNADKSTGVNQGTGNGYWVTDGTTQTDVKQALEALGDTTTTKNVYGYDPAYADSSEFSMGSATKVTVAADTYKEGTTQWPTATFTFKGTGFDVISLTDNNSGAISVKVYSVGNDGTETQVKGTLVNNYYGYTYKDGKWTATPTGDNNALYQIPVIKISGLDYGTYKVVITASYATFADKTEDNQYSFWLDAIRVYDPMGKDNATYTQDKEGYPQYIKLRDSLVNKSATVAGDEEEKMVFIDGGSTAEIATYANYGPNNEVYLAKGQAISFNIPENTNIASIQIGAKAPNSNAAEMDVNGTKTAIPSATEMYYQIATQGGSFTVTNTGEGLLSLTNLKITFKTNPNATVTLAALSDEDQANAVALVRALFAEPVEPFNPDPFTASWGHSVRKGDTATLTVKASEDTAYIKVDGETVDNGVLRTERTGWGWWAKTVTYREFTYTTVADVTTDYTICAVNGEDVSSDAITATLTVRPSVRDWLHGIIGKWF